MLSGAGPGAGAGSAADEALQSAAYVQQYLDCVENLPDDLQRHLTRMRELDVSYRACIRRVESHLSICVSNEVSAAGPRRSHAVNRMTQSLIAAKEIGDEKLQVVQLVQDLIDNKLRHLDIDYRKLVSSREVSTNGTAKEEPPLPVASEREPPPVRDKEPAAASPAPAPPPRHASPPAPAPHERDKEKNDRDNKTGERWSKRPRRARATAGNNASARDNTDGDSGERENVERTAHSNNAAHKKTIGKKKKRKARQSAAAQRSETPTEEADAIDPDEPRYCLCDQISFGEMILCDNDLCPIEWFHFSCVYLTTKPKGKWFCPKCRGDRPNIMKPKGQFLKELERYNKEKEEKA